MGENAFTGQPGDTHEDSTGSELSQAPKEGSLIFESDDGTQIVVPPDATISQNHRGQNYRLTAKEVREGYLPKGFGFHKGMEELAAERKRLQAAAQLAEQIGEDRELVEQFLEFKRQRLEQLGPDEVAYLRRYLSGDPDMAFSRRSAHPGAQAQTQYPSGDYDFDSYQQDLEQQYPQAPSRQAPQGLPPELLAHIGNLERQVRDLAQSSKEKEAAEIERRKTEEWERLKSKIQLAISEDPILKREGKSVAKQILYDVYNTTEGDVELAIKLARQEAEAKQRAFLEAHAGEKLEVARRFGGTLPEGGTPPTSLPPVDVKSYGEKPFKNPQFRRDNMEALKQAFLNIRDGRSQ